MTRRPALVLLAALAALVLAGGALAANTAFIAVSHSPMVLNGSDSTTIHVQIPQSTDSVAVLNIYAPSGYGAALGQAAGTTIGNVSATALSHDTGLVLPLVGPVTTDDVSKHTGDACSPGANAAVWNLNLSVAGQTLVLPVYVNPTSGAAAALGAYDIRICLPPWDVPMGTPGRAFEGAQLLEASFTVNKVFTTPVSAGLLRWEALFTPFNPGLGTPNPAATFEARSFTPLPVLLGLHVSYVKKTKTWVLAGTATEGGMSVVGLNVKVSSGPSPTKLATKATVKTSQTGAFKLSGRARPKSTTYFQVSGSVVERDYTSTGCQNPLTTVAPGGCVSAQLPAWAAKSTIVALRVK
jgi:hypothetical protein